MSFFVSMVHSFLPGIDIRSSSPCRRYVIEHQTDNNLAAMAVVSLQLKPWDSNNAEVPILKMLDKFGKCFLGAHLSGASSIAISVHVFRDESP